MFNTRLNSKNSSCIDGAQMQSETSVGKMLRGDLEKDGITHVVLLTDQEVVYRVKPRNGVFEPNGFTNIWNMGVIPLRRLISISKKVKSLKEDQDSFTINYAANAGSCNLEVKKVKFKGDAETCSKFREKLRTLVNERYPVRKYLVLINPVSGKGEARSVFRRRGEPVLAMGGITTEVVVTERSKHAIELITAFDMSEIEGVVIVGGDGFISECVTGLLIRAQTRNNIDYHNPDSLISPAELPVGIIPAGSGDFIAQYLHGTRDPVTAAIHIVLGHQQKTNVAGIYKGRELCVYSGLLMGFGLIGDIMKSLEEQRWMGAARFQLVPVRSVINRRIVDIEVDYLTDTWHTVSASAYGLDAYVVTWKHSKSNMEACFGDSCMTMYITSKCKLKDHIEQLGKVKSKSSDCWDYDFVNQYQVKGFRVRMPKAPKLQTGEGDSALIYKYYLNTDGEVITIDKPQFEVRLHRDVISLIGDPSLRTQPFNNFVWYENEEVTEP